MGLVGGAGVVGFGITGWEIWKRRGTNQYGECLRREGGQGWEADGEFFSLAFLCFEGLRLLRVRDVDNNRGYRSKIYSYSGVGSAVDAIQRKGKSGGGALACACTVAAFFGEDRETDEKEYEKK